MEDYCMQASTESIPNPPLPKILTSGRKLRDIVKDSLETLYKFNFPPEYFVQGGSIVRFRVDEQHRPFLELVDEAMIIGRLARVANFSKINPKGVEVNCDPPSKIAKDILAKGTWLFPPIVGIVEAPILRPDGTIITEPGYDLLTGLYYFPAPGLEMEPIPLNPTEEDLVDARGTLLELFQDFPFKDQASLANMMGLLITPLVRPALSGNVPLALIIAPQAGTGKTMLAIITAKISTGHDPTFLPYSQDTEEMRKKITSALRISSNVIVMDNVTTEIRSDVLSSALTTKLWGDRLLGRNEMLRLPQQATWIANGNNLRIGGDIPRRCYLIELDAKMSQPWKRKNFHISDPPEWVDQNRRRLMRAIFILIRRWISAGRPDFIGTYLGSFSQWCKVVGGILDVAGISGFLANLDTIYNTTDDEGSQWEAFLLALLRIFKDNWFTTSRVTDALSFEPSLVEALPDELNSPFQYDGRIAPTFNLKLGIEFKKRVNTRYGSSQVFIEWKKDPHLKIAVWHLVCGDAGTCGVSGTDIQNEVLNQNLEVNAPATPAAPAVFENRCVSCSSDNWHSYPDGSGRFCGTCHPPAKRSE